MLIALILYIITSPFSILANWLIGAELDAVKDLQDTYGYNQYIGITDESYLESEGQDYSGLTFTDGISEVAYYNQIDERWKNEPYGRSDKIGTHGCGPTSMAIVISSLTGNKVDPVQMAKWSYEHGHCCEGSGSYHSLIPESAKAFGLNVDSVPVNDPQGLVNALASGKLVVAIMGKGAFTNSGHFIVLRGVTSDGKILVADPASRRKSEMEWDINIILNQARKGAGAGGPFWACY